MLLESAWSENPECHLKVPAEMGNCVLASDPVESEVLAKTFQALMHANVQNDPVLFTSAIMWQLSIICRHHSVNYTQLSFIEQSLRSVLLL